MHDRSEFAYRTGDLLEGNLMPLLQTIKFILVEVTEKLGVDELQRLALKVVPAEVCFGGLFFFRQSLLASF